MFVSTLTKENPSSNSFTLTERTLVQGCVLGGTVMVGSESVKIEVYDGEVYRSYKLSIPPSKPDDFYLAPGTYRVHVDNAVEGTNCIVMLSPATED